MREYKFNDIYIGQSETFTKEITLDMENKFREISGDINPLHFDDNYATEVSDGKFKGHVSFGLLTACLYSTSAGVYLPGKYSLIHSFDELSFLKPVFAGDILSVEAKVVDKNDALRLIQTKIIIRNQNKEIVSKAKMKIIVLK